MTHLKKVTAIICMLLPLAALSQSGSQGKTLSSSEAKRLEKTASSAPQYVRLAEYFHVRELRYRTKAAEEKIEWDRRAQVNVPSYQKFPRPVDSARSLYIYYSQCADSAAAQASRYDNLASGTSLKQ